MPGDLTRPARPRWTTQVQSDRETGSEAGEASGADLHRTRRHFFARLSQAALSLVAAGFSRRGSTSPPPSDARVASLPPSGASSEQEVAVQVISQGQAGLSRVSSDARDILSVTVYHYEDPRLRQRWQRMNRLRE